LMSLGVAGLQGAPLPARVVQGLARVDQDEDGMMGGMCSKNVC
jgi:hypothetical protein